MPTAFRHADARTTGSGVTIQIYEPAGRPEYGRTGPDGAVGHSP